MSATTMGSLAERVHPLLSELNRTPCHEVDRGHTRCFERAPTRGASWADIDPDSLCIGCAAYWHLSRAEDYLRRLDRLRLEVGTRVDRQHNNGVHTDCDRATCEHWQEREVAP